MNPSSSSPSSCVNFIRSTEFPCILKRLRCHLITTVLLTSLACSLTASGYIFTGNADKKCNPNDPNEPVGNPTDWNDPKNWGTPCEPQGPPESGSSVTIPAGFLVSAPPISLGSLDCAGTLFISGDSNINNLTINGSGQLLSANGVWRNVTVTGRFNHSGSAIGAHVNLAPASWMRWNSGTVWGNLTQAPGAILTIESGFDHYINDSIVTLNGTTDWIGTGKIIQGGGAENLVSITNNGSFNALGTGTIESSGDKRFEFINEGTFVKSGVNTSTILHFNSRPRDHFVNRGTLRVESGMLDLQDGSVRLDTGSSLTGAGALRISGGRLYLPPAAGVQVDGKIQLTGGHMEGDAQLSGTGTIDWTGGGIGSVQNNTTPAPATLRIPVGMTLNISGPNDKCLAAEPSFCNACHRQFGQIINEGVVNWSGAGDIYAGDGGAEIRNRGTFNILTDAVIRGSGNFVNEASGLVKKFGASGATEIGRNFGLNNSGTIEVVSGEIFCTSQLTMARGGRCKGVGKLVATNGLLFTGTTTIDGGHLELRAYRVTTGDGISPEATIDTINNGSFDWTGGSMSGTVNMSAGSQLNITGPARKSVGFFAPPGLFLAGTIRNSGTIRWSGTGDLGNDSSGVIENNGLFEIDTDAEFKMTRFDNRGRTRKISGGLTKMQGPVHNYGVLDPQSGDIMIETQLHLRPDSRVEGPGRVVSTGEGFLYGTFTVGSPGWFEHRSGLLRTSFSAEYPLGTIVTSGSGIYEWTGGLIGGTIVVETGSRMRISGSADKGMGYFYHPTIQDAGIIRNKGTLAWPGTGNLVDQNFGQFYNSGTFTVDSPGTMQGRLENSGILEIGSPTGMLSFGGASFTQTPAGTLNMDITGQTPGTGFDRISTNTFSLGGKLKVRLSPSYNPGTGTALQVVSGCTGQFAQIELPSRQYFSADYGAGVLTLTARVFPENETKFKQYYFPDPNEPLSGPNDDADGDGMTNRFEYALGLNPKSGSGVKFTVGMETSGSPTARSSLRMVANFTTQRFLSLSYERPIGLTDVVYLPQRNLNLTGTAWGSSNLIQEILPGSSEGLETVKIRSTVPTDGIAREFIRIGVDAAP